MKKRKQCDWVSAVEIGEASFCAHFLEHKSHYSLTYPAILSPKINSTLIHNKISKLAQDTREHIISQLYGASSLKTKIFHHYRDQKLSNSNTGKLFIRSYYKLTPSLLRLVQAFPILHSWLIAIGDKLIVKIEKIPYGR